MSFRHGKEKKDSAKDFDNVRAETEVDNNEKSSFFDIFLKLIKNSIKMLSSASLLCGDSVKLFSIKFARWAVKSAKAFWGFIEKPVLRLWIRFFKVIKRLFLVFTEPYYSFRSYFRVIKRKLKEAEEDENLSAVQVVFKTIREGIKRNRGLLVRTVLNYTMPVITVAMLVWVVNYVSGLTFAVEVNYKGKTIGAVSREYVYTDAQNMLQQQIVYGKNDKTAPIADSSELTLKIVDEKELVDSNILVDRMVKNSGEEIVEAVGIYINGNLIASVKDAQPIKQAFDEILTSYKKRNSTYITFADKIQLKSGIYLTETLKDEGELVKLFKSNKVEEKTYTIKKGNTPSQVASKFNLSLKQFYKLNPRAKKKFIAGETVRVTARIPYLSVKEVRRERYVQTLDYQVEYVDDSGYLKGYKKVVRQGKEGKAVVTADVTYINGVESSREVVNKKVVKKAVSKKIVRGTKTVSVSYSPGASAKVSGNRQFIWPVNGGYTSSHYGGARVHKGTDIAAPAGTAIYAAASGKVILATWYSGYGKCVIIDHGNGIQTLYGHASAIYVTPGQVVKQGQNIAAVGQTGWATGNHLHFEIRLNGSTINPENYIGAR